MGSKYTYICICICICKNINQNIFIFAFVKNFNPNISVFVFGPLNCIRHTLISRTIGSKVRGFGWTCTFCLLVELHQEGSALIGATPSIFNCIIKIKDFAMLF